MTEGVIALIAAVFGGAGLKLVEKMFAKKEAKYKQELDTAMFSFQDAASIRKELREEANALRGEMKEMRDEVDKWRKEYFKILRKYNEIEIKYENMLSEITVIREILKNKNDPSQVIRSLETRLDMLDIRRTDWEDSIEENNID